MTSATQAMALTRDGRPEARLELCRRSAPEFLLTPVAVNAIIDEVVAGIEPTSMRRPGWPG